MLYSLARGIENIDNAFVGSVLPPLTETWNTFEDIAINLNASYYGLKQLRIESSSANLNRMIFRKKPVVKKYFSFRPMIIDGQQKVIYHNGKYLLIPANF